MGCDIHGFWELYHPDLRRWVAFKQIGSGRSYKWFGILSGVREGGPRVSSMEAAPNIDMPTASRETIVRSGRKLDDENFSRVWVEYCKNWGRDLHSHTIVPYDEVLEANLLMWNENGNDDAEGDVTLSKDQAMMQYYETVPDLDYVVEDIMFDTQWNEELSRTEPLHLPMNLPLRDILKTDDLSDVVRMVVAYDN
jgi:hypothetical protein